MGIIEFFGTLLKNDIKKNTLYQHNINVTDVGICNDHIISTGDDAIIKIYDTATKTIIRPVVAGNVKLMAIKQ